MNSLITYKDWLMLTRGKIEPRIGDKIKTIAAIRGNKTLQNNVVKEIDEVEINEYFSKYSFRLHYRNTYRYIENCYVEVPYPVINNILNIILNEANGIKQKHDINSLCKYQGEYFISFRWLKDMIELHKQQANKLLYGTDK